MSDALPGDILNPVNHLVLVRRIARRFARTRVEVDDLTQEGIVGLIEFCNEHGVWDDSPEKFQKCATVRIRQSIMKSLRKQTWLVMVPWINLKLTKRVERGEIDESTLTDKQKATVAAIQEFIGKAMIHESDLLNETLADILPIADGAGPDESRIELLYKALDKLDERKYFVVAARFGLGGTRIATFREIGETMDLGKERARSLFNEALDKLQLSLDGGIGVRSRGGSKKVGDPARRFLGVYYCPQLERTPWRTMIYIGGKLRQVGNFPTEEGAVEAYDREARRLGRPVNFPRPGEIQAVVGRCGGRAGSKRMKV
jgi:RNA polymerase sigma factor (sigma-70 family)